MRRYHLLFFICFSLLLQLCSFAHAEDWCLKKDGSSWQYRVEVIVNLRGLEAIVDGFPIECDMDFIKLLSQAEINAPVDISSITVFDPDKEKIIPSIFFSYDEDRNRGKLCWKADGTYLALETINYYVYFDLVDVAAKVDGYVEGKNKQKLDLTFQLRRIYEYLFLEDPEAIIKKSSDDNNVGNNSIPFGLYFEAEDFIKWSTFVKAKGAMGGALKGASFAPGSEEKYVYAGPAGPNGVDYTGVLMQKNSSESLSLPSGGYNFYVRFSSFPEQSHTFIVKPEIADNKYGVELNKTATGGAANAWKWESLGGLDLKQGKYGFNWSFKNLEKQLSVDLVLITNYDFTPPDNFCGFEAFIGELEVHVN